MGRAASQDERDAWVSHLEFLRKQNVDIFDLLRITEQEAESASTSDTIEVCSIAVDAAIVF